MILNNQKKKKMLYIMSSTPCPLVHLSRKQAQTLCLDHVALGLQRFASYSLFFRPLVRRVVRKSLFFRFLYISTIYIKKIYYCFFDRTPKNPLYSAPMSRFQKPTKKAHIHAFIWIVLVYGPMHTIHLL